MTANPKLQIPNPRSLHETHVLSGPGAREALERLRPLIRPDAFWAARASLARKP